MNRVTVYVWVSLIKAGSPGHAAMSINGGTLPEDGYLSFAPRESGSISGAGKFFTKAYDAEHYQGRGVWVGTILGLDTDKMLAQLKSDIAQPPTYNAMNECATMVRSYLKIGGGDEYASWWSRNNLPPISPDDVEDYAKSIIKGTREKGSYGQMTEGEGTLPWASWF